MGGRLASDTMYRARSTLGIGGFIGMGLDFLDTVRLASIAVRKVANMIEKSPLDKMRRKVCWYSTIMSASTNLAEYMNYNLDVITEKCTSSIDA